MQYYQSLASAAGESWSPWIFIYGKGLMVIFFGLVFSVAPTLWKFFADAFVNSSAVQF